jgi:Holliday junction resolvase RusA-like endonuclease
MRTELIIYGDIVGNQRPRATVRNGFVKVYDTEKNISYKHLIRSAFMDNGSPIEYGDEPIKLTIEANYSIEKKHYGKKGLNSVGIDKKNGVVLPTKKPDADNIAKIVLDALNKFAYNDDKQITDLIIKKRYVDGNPFVKITLESEEDYE